MKNLKLFEVGLSSNCFLVVENTEERPLKVHGVIKVNDKSSGCDYYCTSDEITVIDLTDFEEQAKAECFKYD